MFLCVLEKLEHRTNDNIFENEKKKKRVEEEKNRCLEFIPRIYSKEKFIPRHLSSF